MAYKANKAIRKNGYQDRKAIKSIKAFIAALDSLFAFLALLPFCLL